MPFESESDFVYEATGDITFRDRTLLAWWRLDEGTGSIAYDSSLYKRSASMFNSPEWVTGNAAIKYGSPYALQMDGATQYAEASATGLTNPNLSLVLWARPRSLPGSMTIRHYFPIAAGSITINGVATGHVTGLFYATGKLLVGGMADNFNSNESEARGYLTINGLARASVTVIYQPSGYNLLFGSAGCRTSSLNNMTGSLNLLGTADYVTGMTYNASGKMFFNGLIRVNEITGIVEGTGKLLLSGLGKTFGIFSYDTSGSLSLTGISQPRTSYSMNAAGKLLFSGKNMSLNQTPYIMVPDGDAYSFGNWTNTDLGTSNFYPYVDEGTVSPNDTDYLFNGFVVGTPNSELIFTLTDTPTSFTSATTATAVMIYVRHARTSDKGTPASVSEVQIMESDNTTAITAIASASSDGTIRTYAYGPAITGNNNKTAWDGARLRIKTNANTDGAVQLYAAQVVLYYDAVLNVQPTGTLIFNGTANPQQDYTADTTGSLTINGIASAEAAGYIGSGRLGFSGTADVAIGGIVNMVGALIVGGTADMVDGNVWLYIVNDTFTPDFTGNISVECWAGGGGGGVTQPTGTGGGGGGAYAKKNTFAVTNGNNYTVNVGTGGVQNVTGDSWFDSTGTVFAAQGINGGSIGGGAGGQAVNCIGDVVRDGGGGGSSLSNLGGAGGGSSAGTAANGNNGSDASGNSGANGGTAVTGGGAGGQGGNNGLDGQAGTAPGGGGGGAGANANPGAGARGQIILRRL